MNGRLIAVVIFFGAILLLSINISKPFVGQHDWNGVVYGQQAKNYLRYGYLPLKFGATLAAGGVPADEVEFSTHYLPTLPLIISLSYRLFGVAEWSTRVVPAAASLAALGLVMALGRELVNARVGLLAGAFMAVTPMFVYYGKNPVHEVLLLPMALLAFYCYQRWVKTERRGWLIGLVGAAGAGMVIGWPGYYAAILIAVHGWWFRPRERSRIWWLPFLAVISFGLFLGYARWLQPQALPELKEIAALRLGGSVVGWSDWGLRQFRYAVNLFTATLLLLSSFWIVRKFDANDFLMVALGLFGIAHAAVFRNAAWYHEYLLFPLLPFLVITAAVTVDRLLVRFLQADRRQMVVVLALVTAVAGERAGYVKALLTSEYVQDVYEKARRYDGPVPEEQDVFFVYYADQAVK